MGLLSMFRPNAGPHPVVESAGVTTSVSSFGLDHTTLGPEFPAFEYFGGERSLELAFREKYFNCTQHDHKMFDWNGAMSPVQKTSQPLLSSGSAPGYYVPLSNRRPSAPYRLGRRIVLSFTSMVFGEGHWPTVLSEDPETQDFVEALIEKTGLRTVFSRARNLAGSTGSVGLSWVFHDGVPKVRVHSSKNVHVLEWEDEDLRIPSHVIELYQYPVVETDPETNKSVKNYYWFRRDWTPKADVRFKRVKVTKKNPVWEIDEEQSYVHDDGFAHFVWVTNIPDDSNPEGYDGQPDYAFLYDQLDSLDVLNSVHVKGTTVNLDPTLKLRMDKEDVDDEVHKGSDNSLITGTDGDADYMTLPAEVVTAGREAIASQREQVLEAAECVIPDPNEVAGAGTSAVALKLIYAPMLAKSDIMREQFGKCIVMLLEQMLKCARARLPNDESQFVEEPVVDDEGNFVFDENGEQLFEQVEYFLDLPPRIEKEEVVDAEGNPTGEFTVHQYDRNPGRGRIWLEWPKYFEETAADRAQESTALSTATGGKPVMSQKTAVEYWASLNNRDPQEEFALIRQEQDAELERQAGMFPGIGGQVPTMDSLPLSGDEGNESEFEGGEQTPSMPTLPALSSEQINLMLEIAAKVASSEIARESGITILKLAFPGLSDREAASIIGEEKPSGSAPPSA